MIDPHLLEQAKRGDAIALHTLLNQSLRGQGIWARVESQATALHVALESSPAPAPDSLVQRIQTGLERLRPQGIHTVIVTGWALGETAAAWERHFNLSSAPETTPAFSPIAPGSPDTSSLPQSPPVRVHRAPRPSQATTGGVRSPAVHPVKKPFVLNWSDFDPMMLAIIGFVAVYGCLGALNPSYDGPFLWLHYPNLAIHETGHLLFMPFGHFLMLVGGSLTQIAFPAVFTGYFFYSRQYFSSALTLFWTGQNFMDVAVYMADAPYRALPLTVDNIDAHDWWQLFNMMNCLGAAEFIAGLTHAIGVLLYLAAVIAGVYVAYRSQQEMEAQRRRREQRLWE
ncbi:MAG TPA: hypothetical protein V6D02_11340 [Candidatus Obscuribacterales bacterium]